ncbi:MAG: NAD-dependent epimerase/dehydratase family protein [Desulfuromonadaceae bacterium]
MTILITGATGFLGRKVASSFANTYKGDIRCLVRPGTDLRGLKDACGDQYERLQLVQGTLLSVADCKKIIQGVDLVVHLASGTSGSPAEHFLNSSVASRNLISAMTLAKAKLLHCSSFSVYGCSELPAGTIVNENTITESVPQKRDVYAQSKIHQENLVIEMCKAAGISYSIIRPGVIYGPNGSAISSRVGLKLFGRFLHLGRNTLLPLTYVDNCADVFRVVVENGTFNGDIYNVVDDDLVTSREFLRQYCKKVEKLKSIPIPYWVLYLISMACEKYFVYSGGQLPDIFTRYKTKSMWKGFKYSNAKLKKIGWNPKVSTEEGLLRHFNFLANR